MIANDPRWDDEMLAALRQDEAAALEGPADSFDEQRRAADIKAIGERESGPRMASEAERWVQACGRRVLCRVYQPRSGQDLPVLFYVHGGGWAFGSLDTYDRLMRSLAAGAGCAVVGVDYALSPEATFPRALDECVAVLRRVVVMAAAWGLDPQRLVLAGDSAGANLAFATALALRNANGRAFRPAARGVLAIYPVCDPAMDTPSYAEFSEGYGLSAAEMAAYWDLYAPNSPSHTAGSAGDAAILGAVGRASPFASIIDAELGGLPPSLILAAELDVLRSEGEAMAERLAAAGVETTHHIARGMAHGFMRRLPDAARSLEIIEVATAWLRERFAP